MTKRSRRSSIRSRREATQRTRRDGRKVAMREAFGYANIEWKRGIDWEAVRAFRRERAQDAMKRHGLGAMLLMYDENIRYATSTLTPGWNKLKPGLRYA